MICANELEKEEKIEKEIFENFLKILAPFAPHICEEIWQILGHKKSIFLAPWPKWDEKLVKEEMITLIIQVNGKVRDKIEVESDISEERAKELAISSEKIKKWISDKKIKKVIFVPGKLINIVT
jgi:leucyl-tRNA synthetase